VVIYVVYVCEDCSKVLKNGFYGVETSVIRLFFWILKVIENSIKVLAGTLLIAFASIHCTYLWMDSHTE